MLEETREIDLTFYPNIGPIDWYLVRYKPWHTAFAATDGERIVGYLAALPARKELYDAILNGVLIDDLGINPEMFLKESAYYYAGSVLLRREYRGRGIGRQLLNAFIDKYGSNKICLIAVSEGGRRLAERYFTLVKSVSGGIGIFASKVDGT